MQFYLDPYLAKRQNLWLWGDLLHFYDHLLIIHPYPYHYYVTPFINAGFAAFGLGCSPSLLLQLFHLSSFRLAPMLTVAGFDKPGGWPSYLPPADGLLPLSSSHSKIARHSTVEHF